MATTSTFFSNMIIQIAELLSIAINFGKHHFNPHFRPLGF